jgi:hypothetical protein
VSTHSHCVKIIILRVRYSVCVTSMVRLQAIKTFGLTADATWDNVPITFWTTLETTTAMLCACLPTIRAGLLSVFSQAFGSSAAHTSTAIATMNKPTITYQKSFGTFWRPKSWTSHKLNSVPSLSIHNDEVKSNTGQNERLRDLEALRRPYPSVAESLNKPLPEITHVYQYDVKDLLATPFRPAGARQDD